MTFIKTLLHCWYHLIIRPLPSTLEAHRMCSEIVHGPDDDKYRSFCSCGYQNDGVTFDQMIDSHVPKCVECDSRDDQLGMLLCPDCKGAVCMTCAQLFHDCTPEIE